MTPADPSSRDDATLADILRAAQLAREFVAGLDHDAFLDDVKRRLPYFTSSWSLARR
jgi:uncharacterized protein with HEPN domain